MIVFAAYQGISKAICLVRRSSSQAAIRPSVQANQMRPIRRWICACVVFLTELDNRLRQNMKTMRASPTRVPPNECGAAHRRYLDSINANPKAAIFVQLRIIL